MMARRWKFETLGEIGGIGKSGTHNFRDAQKGGGAGPAFSIYLHLQLQMDTSAKYKANRTEIVGGVVRRSILNVNQGQ